MMCNFSTDFLRTCRGSTNIAIHRRLAKIIDIREAWLECVFFERLTINFIFGMPTHIFSQGLSVVGDALTDSYTPVVDRQI